MFRSLQVLTLVLVAVAMALSLAHALELPGKLRLGKEAYMAVQPIYYPGFTFGGLVGEFGGMVALLVLLVATGFGTPRFGWTLAAFLLLVTAHGAYWLFTHPVNNFWLKDVELAGLGGAFFSLFAPDVGSDWTRLRDAWEYSHVARAVLMTMSFISLAIAVTA